MPFLGLSLQIGTTGGGPTLPAGAVFWNNGVAAPFPVQWNNGSYLLHNLAVTICHHLR